jgi:hypothetical protein
MKWWNNLWRTSAKSPIGCARLTLPGWTEDTPLNEMRIWRDECGNVLSLAVTSTPLTDSDRASETALRNRCRGLAQSRSAGLLEASATSGGIKLIYKRLEMPAYIYTGMFMTQVRSDWLIWTVVAGERGMTGVREAVVTAQLISEGKLAPEDYEHRWSGDPYDPNYSRVDRSVLRFMSDDESYDAQFPQHPLSKVRHLLASIPNHVTYDS